MKLEEFERLLSGEGQSALRLAADLCPDEDSRLSVLEALRRNFDAELARLATSMALLRRAARKKFVHAERMYFTHDALEQASGDVVAEYRAERFRGFAEIGDYCCGIGGDTLALAGVATVQAIDIDPLRLRMARANAEALKLETRVSFLHGDFQSLLLPTVDAAFIDPDRRASGQRQIRLEAYTPSWRIVTERMSRYRAWGVKAAPAVPWSDLHSIDAEVEFVSVEGELKECILWFGELRTIRRRATILPARISMAAEHPVDSIIGPVREYVHDPDPAVTRAGLVANLGEALGAHQIDPAGAFLSSDQPSPTPMARSYRVEAVFPFHLSRLRDGLRERRVGAVTWLKRGSAVDVERLKPRLRLSGDEHRWVILTRIDGQPSVIISPGYFKSSSSTMPESR